MEGLADIINSIGQANGFIWSLFNGILSMIMDNALIAVPVLLAVVFGAVGIVMRVLRRFGVRGAR